MTDTAAVLTPPTVDRTDSTYWEDRVAGETNRWFRRFRRYLLLPGDRSLLDAVRSELLETAVAKEKLRLGVETLEESSLDRLELRCKKRSRNPSGAWTEAYKLFAWEARAEAFDNWQYRQEQIEVAQYRRQLRARERRIATALGDRAEEMLNHPLLQEQKIKGGKIVVLEPAKWTLRDAVAMFEMMSVLGRRGAGMHDVDLLSAIDILTAEGLDPGVLQASEDGYESFRDRLREALRAKSGASTLKAGA